MNRREINLKKLSSMGNLEVILENMYNPPEGLIVKDKR